MTVRRLIAGALLAAICGGFRLGDGALDHVAEG
jgi:hypothetical protein